MKRDICKNCNKRTKYMFHFNQGLYCDKCKELGAIIQKQNLSMEMFKDKLRVDRENWSRPVLYSENP